MPINSVALCGNLTRDPELRSTASGMAVLSFGLAVNERKKNNQTGQWDEVANFFDCTYFGNGASGIAPYLKKGMKVTVAGKLHQSRWQDKQTGQNRSKVEVIVNDLELPPKGQQQPYQPAPAAPYQQYQQPPMQPAQAPVAPYQQPPMQPQQQQPQQVGTMYDEDIPF